MSDVMPHLLHSRICPSRGKQKATRMSSIGQLQGGEVFLSLAFQTALLIAWRSSSASSVSATSGAPDPLAVLKLSSVMTWAEQPPAGPGSFIFSPHSCRVPSALIFP
eukprot:549464-Pyramimonas_sp.AAC.1